MKEIVILGGPNGAGKTTAARVLLPAFFCVQEFVNADEIARRLSPNNVEAAALAAGREMLERIHELLAAGISFGFETTCAGKSYARLLQSARHDGWRVTLLFLWLDSPETAVERVARRVAEGGHVIPIDTIRRRYRSGLENLLSHYLPLADEAEIYDNSGSERVLIAERREAGALQIPRSAPLGKNQEGNTMRSMTSNELHEAIQHAMAEVSRRLAAGELDRSGRFYSENEWRERLAQIDPKNRIVPGTLPPARRRRTASH